MMEHRDRLEFYNTTAIYLEKEEREERERARKIEQYRLWKENQKEDEDVSTK